MVNSLDEGTRNSVIIDRIWNELRTFVSNVMHNLDYEIVPSLEPLAEAILCEYIPKLGETKNELISISKRCKGLTLSQALGVRHRVVK